MTTRGDGQLIRSHLGEAEAIGREQHGSVPLRGVVLDFDGVIVESEEIKDRAFLELFADHRDKQDGIAAYHLDNKHLGRLEKFEFVVRQILGGRWDEWQEQELTEQFSRLTRQKIIDCPMVPGALDLLKILHGHIPLFISSATPQRDLDFIVKGRGLERYFEMLFGTPWRKVETLKYLVGTLHAKPDQLIVVGDTAADYLAAAEVGAQFIGRDREGSLREFPVAKFADLRGVREELMRRSSLRQTPRIEAEADQ